MTNGRKSRYMYHRIIFIASVLITVIKYLKKKKKILLFKSSKVTFCNFEQPFIGILNYYYHIFCNSLSII